MGGAASVRIPPLSTHPFMPIAFKEWAVTVRALAEGEQLVTLRKGGIREPGRHFSLDHERFFLYPTFDHQRCDLVRESHLPELRRALEEGVWPDGEPPPHALTADGGIPQPDRVRIRAWAEVAASWTVTDQRTVDALAPFHVWTTDYAEKRLHWKRRHPLNVLLLRAYRIPRPATVCRCAPPGPRGRSPSRCATTTAAAARSWRSRATCRSRAPRCSPTRRSTARPRRSARSSSRAAGPRTSNAHPGAAGSQEGAPPQCARHMTWVETESETFTA